MKLVSFSPKGAGPRRSASSWTASSSNWSRRGSCSTSGRATRAPRHLESLLADWEEGFGVARRDRGPRCGASPGAEARLASARFPVSEVRFHPPVRRPPSLRDFYAFETHVKNARARRGLTVPPEWYEFPVFYFSNPAALQGHGEPVRSPRGPRSSTTSWRSPASSQGGSRRARRGLARGDRGLHDPERLERARHPAAGDGGGLGPAKGKDFATRLGPALVTPDELEPAQARGPLRPGHGSARQRAEISEATRATCTTRSGR